MSVAISLRLAITLALVAVIVVLSVTPGQARTGDSGFVWLVATTPTTLQKILHLLVYACLAMLWAWTLEGIGSRWLRFGAAFVLSVALGVVLEWLQTQIPGRFGSFWDTILNAAGALLGIAAAFVLL